MVKVFRKSIALYLAFALMLLSIPAQGWAMFIPSATTGQDRQADLQTVQKTLESTVVKQRLSDLGLSTAEAAGRINTLSDAQLHQVAANLDSLQAGGDGADLLIFLLLVAIIAVVVLEATGHHVIIR